MTKTRKPTPEQTAASGQPNPLTLTDPRAELRQREAEAQRIRREIREVERQPPSLEDWAEEVRERIAADGASWDTTMPATPREVYAMMCRLEPEALLAAKLDAERARRERLGLGDGIPKAEREARLAKLREEEFAVHLAIVRTWEAATASGFRDAELLPSWTIPDAVLFGERVTAPIAPELAATGRRRCTEVAEQHERLAAIVEAAWRRLEGARDVLEELRRHAEHLARQLGSTRHPTVSRSEFLYGEGANAASPRGQRVSPQFIQQVTEQEAEVARLAAEHKTASARARQAGELAQKLRARLRELGVNPDRPTGIRQVTDARDAESWSWRDRETGERHYPE